MRRITLLISMLLLMCSVQAMELPPAFTAHYVVKKGPLQLGVSMRQLERGEDGLLVYRTSSDTTGLADLLYSDHVRESTTLWVDRGLALPLEYSYSRTGKRNRTLSQVFDWDDATVASTLNNELEEFELDSPTFDLNGYQLNLMVGLAGGLREFDYAIAGKHGPKVYEIRHVGEETLKTGLGDFDTVVIQRKSNQTTTLWCASELYFLPVKIEHEENGSTFTAYLESVEGLGRATDN